MKYSIYKILAVTFLTHLILSGIWQQLVNLTWELTFIFKDFIDMLGTRTGNIVFNRLSSVHYHEHCKVDLLCGRRGHTRVCAV
ncbi:hypothetical protein WDU94_011018 [Cyamophila willieti]